MSVLHPTTTYIPNYSLSIVTLISMARSDQLSTRKSRSPFEVLRFIAWLLLLLVSISTPAVKSLFFFSLTSNKPGSILIRGTNYSTTGVVRFGAYGYCIPFVSDGYVVRLRVLLSYTQTTQTRETSPHCSNGVLGHTFDATVQVAL